MRTLENLQSLVRSHLFHCSFYHEDDNQTIQWVEWVYWELGRRRPTLLPGSNPLCPVSVLWSPIQCSISFWDLALASGKPVKPGRNWRPSYLQPFTTVWRILLCSDKVLYYLSPHFCAPSWARIRVLHCSVEHMLTISKCIKKYICIYLENMVFQRRLKGF